MALINSVLGRIRGKIGDVVFTQNKGRQIAKLYQPNVANPRTGQQQANRSRFVALLALGKLLRVVLPLGFKEYASSLSWLNRFMSTNSSNGLMAWDEPTSSWLPAYQNLVISEGSLYPTTIEVNTLVAENLTIKWFTNIFANQSADDELVIIAFVAGQTVMSIRQVIRSDGDVTLTFGTAPANGQVISICAFFITSDARIVSNSYALNHTVVV